MNPSSKSANSIRINNLPDILEPKEYIGRSYNTDNGEFGTDAGVGFQIFDVDRFVADNPDYYSAKRLGYSDATTFAFTDFESYQKKSNYTNKTSGGFNLNFGLFSIGATHKFDNSFSSDFKIDQNHVFGELNVIVKDASYELVMSDNIIKKIQDSYIKPSFLDELYNIPTSEVIKNYGGFVISGLTTGGKANALFTGEYNTSATTEIKTYSMENSINASFTFKPKSTDKSDANFTLGNTNGSTIATQNNIFNFKATVKTYGGSYGFGTFTVPKSIDDIHIDLGGWASSLNDKSNHVLVDFTDNGLRPLSDFVIPVNLRQNIKDIITTQYGSSPSFYEPIILVYCSGGAAVTFMLRTRFGDAVILDNANYYQEVDDERLPDVINYAKQVVANRWLPFYKVKVVAKYVAWTETPETAINYQHSIQGNIDEVNMKKFRDSKSNMLYLLSQANGNKFAYAIHDDYVLDTYGIRDWVNAMATATITLDELKNYKTVAL
jgi:hypothetical protein